MQVLYRAFRHVLEWVTGEPKEYTPPERHVTAYCYPHLNALVDEFLYRWGRGEMPISQSTRYEIKDKTWWEVRHVGQPESVSIWTHGIQMEIRLKDIATIKIPDHTRRIAKHADLLEIEWLTLPSTATSYCYFALIEAITLLLLSKDIVTEPVMKNESVVNNETRGLSAGELSELTKSARTFWGRVHQYAMPGVIYPDTRQGYDVKFEGSLTVDAGRKEYDFVFVRLQDKAEFKLNFTTGATPTDVVNTSIEYNQNQFNVLAIIIAVEEALKPDEYFIGGTGQKVTNGVAEPLADTLKRALDEFLDSAPLVSTTNFSGEPKEFVLGVTFIVSIQRYETFRPGNLRLHIYDIDRTLLAKINYAQRDNVFQVERPRERIMLNDLVEVFDFHRYPVGINYHRSDYKAEKRHLDSAYWAALFESLLDTTKDQFAGGQTLWQQAVGVISSKEVRTCGYIRKVGNTDYLELTIRYEGEESHQAHGKVILHYCIGSNKVTRLDQNNNALLGLGAYHVGNYLNHTPTVEKEESVLDQHQIKPTGGSRNLIEIQPSQHPTAEPKLLNESGDDISDEWVAWHVRWRHSSLGMAVKAGLRQAEQLRKQLENVLNKYEN